jgi:hypothetical protein
LVDSSQFFVALSVSFEHKLGVSLSLVEKGRERVLTPARGELQRLARDEEAAWKKEFRNARNELHRADFVPVISQTRTQPDLPEAFRGFGMFHG